MNDAAVSLISLGQAAKDAFVTPDSVNLASKSTVPQALDVLLMRCHTTASNVTHGAAILKNFCTAALGLRSLMGVVSERFIYMFTLILDN